MIGRLAVGAIALAMLLSPAAHAADPAWQGRTLRACETEDGYPPFAFMGEQGHAKGFSVDVIEAAIADTGLRLEVTFLPTKRCNAALDLGTMDLSMEDTWDASTDATWLPTDPIWDIKPALYYDHNRHPEGISVADVRTDPTHHRGCGLLGLGYGELAPGQVDDRSYRFADAITRLLRGECEFFPESVEFGLAFQFEGRRITDDPRIGWVAYPLIRHVGGPDKYRHDAKLQLYLYLRHSYPGALALIARLNQVIAAWRRTGHDREVMSHYIDLTALEGTP